MGTPRCRGVLRKIKEAAPRPSVACFAASGAATPTAPEPAPLERLADVLTMLFPVWALISGTTAFFYPSTLNWITNQQVGMKGGGACWGSPAGQPGSRRLPLGLQPLLHGISTGPLTLLPPPALPSLSTGWAC